MPIGLIAGVIALIGVLFLPTPDSLPVAGHRMLAILAFAVVVWITEAVSYEASAIMITSLMAFLIGTAPVVGDPSLDYGTSRAISMALTGFANPALALVAGALFIAAPTRLNSDLAERLECAVDDGPLGPIIRTDAEKMTTVPGVYAAGDVARAPHTVTWAASDGVTPGLSVHRTLVFG